MADHYLFGSGRRQAIMESMIRLLVADDAPFIREIVRNTVLRASIQVVGEAANGTEAVKMALELKPDVILMDIIMPELNGVEAAKQILEKLPDVKIVAFSTADHKSIMDDAIAAGCAAGHHRLAFGVCAADAPGVCM